MKFRTPKIIQIVLLVAFAAAMIAMVNRSIFENAKGPYLFLLLGDTVPGEIKIYWNTGNGYHEQETSIKTTREYDQQLLRFQIPDNLIGFRADVDLPAESFEILSSKIGYFRWPFSYEIPAISWTSGNQTNCLPSTDDQARLTVQLAPDATDPYCLVQLPKEEATPWAGLKIYQWLLNALTLIPLVLLFTFMTLRRMVKQDA